MCQSHFWLGKFGGIALSWNIIVTTVVIVVVTDDDDADDLVINIAGVDCTPSTCLCVFSIATAADVKLKQLVGWVVHFVGFYFCLSYCKCVPI